MSKTLIILNPHAAGGRAGKLWTKIEPMLWEKLGALVVAVTQNPQEVAQHLDKAYASGLDRVISIGGDGTNHAMVNALAALSERNPNGPPVSYGILPVGTGRDWARSAGIPMSIDDAAAWIASAEPTPTDIGLVTWESGRQEHFLNIASAGISGEVDRRVNSVKRRRRWTFLSATIATILGFEPAQVKVMLDDAPWYEGKSWLVAVANGSTFGRGMKIAPNARIDDGLFDVLLIENVSKMEALKTLRRVYDGSHLTHPAVRVQQARRVTLESRVPLMLDLDGEHAQGMRLEFSVRPHMLQLLTRKPDANTLESS